MRLRHARLGVCGIGLGGLAAHDASRRRSLRGFRLCRLSNLALKGTRRPQRCLRLVFFHALP